MEPNEDLVRLTYRELADKLGISISAARSRVRRAKQQGRWRVVPRNHPNSPAQIELPAQDAIIQNQRSNKAGLSGGVAEANEALYLTSLTALRDVYRHLSELNDRLKHLAADNTALTQRLSASETSRLLLLKRLEELEDRARSQEERLTAATFEKLESAVEISRLSTICDERAVYIERLEAGVRSLQGKLRFANRPLWKKALGIRR